MIDLVYSQIKTKGALNYISTWNTGGERGSAQMGHARMSMSRSNFRFSAFFPISVEADAAAAGDSAMARVLEGAIIETKNTDWCLPNK